MNQRSDVLSGYIVENETRLTLRQLCDACQVRADYVLELVEEGVIDPSGIEHSHWCFNGISIKRVRKARHLQQDLGINTAGIALALELIDEVEQLRSQLAQYRTHSE